MATQAPPLESPLLLSSTFFEFLAVLPPVLVVSYLRVQQRKKYLIREVLLSHILAIFQSLKTIGLLVIKICSLRDQDRDET